MVKTYLACVTNSVIENNPEVMTTLVHKLGLLKNFSFHNVFSRDDPDLLAFVPRPAQALLLVFPVSETYKKYRKWSMVMEVY